ncbi:homocysteine S-methyltransferase family protein [Clostridium tarantellae]|uniref:Hcy-binding domain-containing protein n=1 Tax=Clostridium tarantellae TaxID=39493 RepID=A0A6I1MFM6_9CLOT|nr:homocysteine S-methyltransferase family protein [Clostridium tarantellae]MPQ42306.1 hypothetical protein [Clostridium tarantellae]
MNILEYIEDNILLFDGAMGTKLKEVGWDMSCSSELLNLSRQYWVKEVYEKYIDAGAKAITTNTFMCSLENSEKYGYKLEEVIKNAVDIAREVINNRGIYLSLSVGPSCEFFKKGEVDLNKVYENYKTIGKIANKCDIDVIAVETILNIEEGKLALKALKETTKVPIFITMSLCGGNKEFLDASVKEICKVYETLGANAVGINCSNSPKEIKDIVKEFLKFAKVPVIVRPNAGIPKNMNGNYEYDCSIEEYVNYMKEFIKDGVKIIGGCCGTNENFIKELKQNI